MRSVAVGIAGAIGSGKTSVATAIHHVLGGTFVSFGEYVRAEARSKNLGEARETLQDLGESLIAEQGWDGFCQGTLAHFGWHHGATVVIDGVRHVEMVSALRRLVAPSPLALVFVTANEGIRVERLKDEGLSDNQRRVRVDNHSTEAQVRGPLLDIADLLVDGTVPADRNAREILAWLSRELLTN